MITREATYEEEAEDVLIVDNAPLFTTSGEKLDRIAEMYETYRIVESDRLKVAYRGLGVYRALGVKNNRLKAAYRALDVQESRLDKYVSCPIRYPLTIVGSV